ncbi:MAG TPA: hypothetical protein VMV01_04390, partial [Planctomycetota bacterium]|nr:hypothetical protein [Planctomycetota bacterium]
IAALGYAGPAGGGAPRPDGKARLAGTLRVRGGAAPPGGLRLVLVALDASRTETVLALGADGTWDAGEPAPGCWRLRVLQDGQDAPLLERDVMLDPGESQSVELVVEPVPR